MSILDVHDIYRNKPNVCAHRIKVEYKQGDAKVYIICEGVEDLGYYGQVIRRKFEQLKIRKYFAGGKDNVLKVYASFDWSKYEKNRILFFVDRDFSYWVKEPQYIDTNVYITDQYSFENDAVNVDMFMNVLEDFYCFSNATERELNQIKEMFFERWHSFYTNSTYVMAAVLVSNIINKEHYAKCIDINKLLKIEADKVWVDFVKGQPIKEYLYEKLKISNKHEAEIIQKQRAFENAQRHYYVRGKWALRFMVKLLEYIMNNARQYVPSLYTGEFKEPKRMCQLTEDGTMTMLAPRIVPPKSLEYFLNVNIIYA